MSEHSYCEMLRAAKPYVGAQNEDVIEHLIHTGQLLECLRNPAVRRTREDSDLSMCSVGGQEINWEGLLNAVRCYLGCREQQLIDRLLQMFQMFRMFRTLRSVMEIKQMMEEMGVVPDMGDFAGFNDMEATEDTDEKGKPGMNLEMILDMMQAMGMDVDTSKMPDLKQLQEMMQLFG